MAVKRRLLITGGSGLLALNCACALRQDWEILLCTHRHKVRLDGVATARLDLLNRSAVLDALESFSPDLLVHTAGMTSVDACEENPAQARRDNAETARMVAEAAASLGVRLAHISTDHLFAGNRRLYREDETPEPLNEYARGKLLAEEWVRQACPKALLVRTNFFGWGHAHRKSFSDWIIENLRGGRPLTMFDDVHFTPILADRLALAIVELADRSVEGVVNVVGDERVSKYQFALRVARCFGLPSELISHSLLSDAHLQALRPHDMSLDNSKASLLLGRRLGKIDDFLEELRAQEAEGRRETLLKCVSVEV